MIIAVIFIRLANHAQPVSSGLGVVLNAGVGLEEIEPLIKSVSENAQAQAGATIDLVLEAVKVAVEGKASITEVKTITVDTELFG